MSDSDLGKTSVAGEPGDTGPWDPALATLREWDPGWAQTCVKMTANPWTAGVLPRKFIELVSVALNAACTNLNPDGTRRHIRAALAAGATREEILFVLKCGALMSIHSSSLGAPILLEEAKAAGVEPALKPAASTPACDAMRAVGQWNMAWESFFELDPLWTDEFFAAAVPIYKSGVLRAKEPHMYSPGTRRHIKAALKAGATMEEVMEVLKLCVVQGVQACNLGVPILAEELGAPRARLRRLRGKDWRTPVTDHVEMKATGPDASSKLAIERTSRPGLARGAEVRPGRWQRSYCEHARHSAVL